MTTTASWYVLIEEDTRESRRVDGTSLKFHRWKLTGTHPIEGNETQAAAAAEDAALHYTPPLMNKRTRLGDQPARSAFRTPDGTWLVALTNQHNSCHIRISTAQLVHHQEEVQAPPAPRQDWKTKVRTFFAPAPPPPHPGPGRDPWAPPTE
ncbi:hypothetical protein [Streptomyces sp. NPDC052701]|uniref:hypothetical protein n=1 Tax=Streptomyces sp. NPDC052701 TaxID=3155533 RepID=UPI00342CBB2B